MVADRGSSLHDHLSRGVFYLGWYLNSKAGQKQGDECRGAAKKIVVNAERDAKGARPREDD